MATASYSSLGLVRTETEQQVVVAEYWTSAFVSCSTWAWKIIVANYFVDPKASYSIKSDYWPWMNYLSYLGWCWVFVCWGWTSHRRKLVHYRRIAGSFKYLVLAFVSFDLIVLWDLNLVRTYQTNLWSLTFWELKHSATIH